MYPSDCETTFCMYVGGRVGGYMFVCGVGRVWGMDFLCVLVCAVLYKR